MKQVGNQDGKEPEVEREKAAKAERARRDSGEHRGGKVRAELWATSVKAKEANEKSEQ
jgi:hypothetical protein